MYCPQMTRSPTGRRVVGVREDTTHTSTDIIVYTSLISKRNHFDQLYIATESTRELRWGTRPIRLHYSQVTSYDWWTV